MSKNRIAALSSAAVMLLMAGPSLAGHTVVVDQKDMNFSVSQLSIKKGDVVEFTNSDDTAHNITIKGPGVTINSGLQQPGVTFKAPFMVPGNYTVVCGIHPNMRMSIKVQ